MASTEHSAASLAVGRDMDKSINAASKLAFDLECALDVLERVERSIDRIAVRAAAVAIALGT